MKLSRPGGAAAPAPQPQEQAQERPQPRGWANAGTSAAPAQDSEQRERIHQQINPERNREAFSAGVGAQADAIRGQDYSAGNPNQNVQQEDTAPKPTRTRRTSTPAPEPANDGASEAVKAAVMEFANAAGTQYKRLKAVEIAATLMDPEGGPDELFQLADVVLSYVEKAA